MDGWCVLVGDGSLWLERTIPRGLSSSILIHLAGLQAVFKMPESAVTELAIGCENR